MNDSSALIDARLTSRCSEVASTDSLPPCKSLTLGRGPGHRCHRDVGFLPAIHRKVPNALRFMNFLPSIQPFHRQNIFPQKKEFLSITGGFNRYETGFVQSFLNFSNLNTV